MKQKRTSKWVLLLACIATQIALGEPSLAEKNVTENAAIKRNGSLGTYRSSRFGSSATSHYVGASGISSFLISRDTGFETTVPRIGFRVC